MRLQITSKKLGNDVSFRCGVTCISTSYTYNTNLYIAYTFNSKCVLSIYGPYRYI